MRGFDVDLDADIETRVCTWARMYQV
jgi:hypothetical protein